MNFKENFSGTPLFRATKMGYLEVVQLLLAAPDIDVNAVNNVFNRTPLSVAAETGYQSIVQLLLQGPGVDLDVEDEHSMTPLDTAD